MLDLRTRGRFVPGRKKGGRGNKRGDKPPIHNPPDVEERDLEERDLTKLVGALAEVSSSVGCAVGQHNLADDRSELEEKDTYLFFKVMQSRTSGRRLE